MVERKTRRECLEKIARTAAGAFVTLGLLGGPVFVLIGLEIQEAPLKEASKASRYLVQVDGLVQNPGFISLMPPVALPARTRIIQSTYFTDNQPVMEEEAGRHKYILRDAIESYGVKSFRRLQEVVIVDPANFSVVDRYQK